MKNINNETKTATLTETHWFEFKCPTCGEAYQLPTECEDWRCSCGQKIKFCQLILSGGIR